MTLEQNKKALWEKTPPTAKQQNTPETGEQAGRHIKDGVGLFSTHSSIILLALSRERGWKCCSMGPVGSTAGPRTRIRGVLPERVETAKKDT
ncbi:hypothetical protein CgunFtcFv8_006558 [Champsocephalus gunnari]|uniref:Uncharacterized protein n=1 Tax=Champsocephalus gunnari TaxID=52237 RepID=A0AAN8BZ33_CHAGU|nr:hypothetical protein CgunFtcFv8_006558 [Champsocephalus gunnari]